MNVQIYGAHGDGMWERLDGKRKEELTKFLHENGCNSVEEFLKVHRVEDKGRGEPLAQVKKRQICKR